ncbi:hypothetical protein [Streptomyces sp. NPDC017940]|uniref:hypothetical protein n=1 Tax=Streptomyces sp. NPDC017940 TaxID=3365017 RepID=UPI0037B89684
MTGKQMMTVAVLAAVLVWSTVMTVLGQLAAVAALLPSLGLLIQQVISALHSHSTRHSTTTTTGSAPVPTGTEGPSR